MSREEQHKAFVRMNASFDRIKAGLADYVKECGDEYLSGLIHNLDILLAADPEAARQAIRTAPDDILDEILFMARAGAGLCGQASVEAQESMNELEGR